MIAHGPYIGYYINEKNSWLIIKEQYLSRAKEICSNSKIQSTTDYHRHLGAFIGTEANKETFVHEKISEWIKQLEYLSEVSKTQHRTPLSMHFSMDCDIDAPTQCALFRIYQHSSGPY